MRFLNPSEKKKYYSEQLALLILKSTYSDRFSGLQHVGQDRSPDLQDAESSIGIEVATAFTKTETTFFYDKYWGKELPQRSRIDQKMKASGDLFLFDEERRVVYLYPDAAYDLTPEQASEREGEPIVTIGQKKVDKLNDGHYDRFKTNGLFIFAENHVSATTIWNNVGLLAGYQKQRTQPFDLFFCRFKLHPLRSPLFFMI